MSSTELRSGLFALTIATSIVTSASHATNRIWWDGLPPYSGDGTTFLDGDNWNPPGVPGSADRLFFVGLGGQLILNQSRTIDGLTVGSDSDVDLVISATRTLTLDGTGGPDLQVGDANDVGARLEFGPGTIAASHVLVDRSPSTVPFPELIVSGPLQADFVQVGVTGAAIATFGFNSTCGRLDAGGSPVTTVDVTSTLELTDSLGLVVEVGATVSVPSGGLLRLRDGHLDSGLLSVWGSGRAEIDGTLHVDDFGDLDVVLGGRLTRQAGGNVLLTTGGNANCIRAASPGSRIECDGITVGAFDELRADIGGTVDVAPPGAITVSGTDALLFVDDGVVECGSLVVQNGGNYFLNSGEITVNGGTMLLDSLVTNIDGTDPGDPGVLRLENGATGQVPLSLSVGGNSEGRLEVASGSTLTGTGATVNDRLSIGRAGIGDVVVTGNSVVDFKEGVEIGVWAAGTGTVTVSGASSTSQRSTLRAVGGGADELRVGVSGAGNLAIESGGLAECGGDTLIGMASAGDGAIHVGGTQNGAQAELIVGDDLLVGVDESLVDQGDGALEVAIGGRVFVPDRTLLGPDDGLVVSGGTLITGSLEHANMNPFGLQFTNGIIAIDGGLLSLASGVLTADGPTPVEFPAWQLSNGATASVNAVRIGFGNFGGVDVFGGASLAASSGVIGAATSGQGFLTVYDGASCDFGSLDVGQDGFGFVLVGQNADLFVGGELTLGIDVGAAEVYISGGSQLYVDGTLEAGSAFSSGTALVQLVDAELVAVDDVIIRDGSRLECDDRSTSLSTGLVPEGVVAVTLLDAQQSAPAGIVRAFGSVTLGGSLEIALDPSFVPVANAGWTVIAAASLAGGFVSTTLPAIPNAQFVVEQLPDRLIVRVQPDVAEDVDLDGMVGVGDLLQVLADWGPCAAAPALCPADVDGDGDVDVNDLLAVLAGWGV